MKKILAFVCLLLSVYVASAQSKKITYTGTIKGYSANMGFTTVRLLVDNIVTGSHEVYLIDIKPDGTFFTSFTLLRSQECLVTFPFFYDYVYFEPGKKLVQDFDVADPLNVSSVFKGDSKLALINNDINKVRPILKDENWNDRYADIYQLTPEQYKVYFLNIRARKLRMIDSVAKEAGMSKVAYELARQNVQYLIGLQLIQYNHMRDYAYRMKNKLPFTSKKPELAPVRLNISYYNFLKGMKYDKAAMASWNYCFFLRELRYIDPIIDKAGRKDYTAEIKILKSQDTLDSNDKATIEYYESAAWMNRTEPGELEKARPIVLKKLLNNDISLGLELMYLQSVSEGMDEKKDTLSAAEFANIKSKIKNKFLLADVEELNNKIKENIRSAKTQTGFASNQSSVNTPADSFFVKLVDKYKGKVVFIDFWATWCSPCLISIKEMAPLKEDLAKNKDIVFLYITNSSSPEKTYQTVMPGIKGEHYRVTDDEYNLLAKQFQINGIPHYAIINKRGEVVDGHFRWGQTDEIKKELLALVGEN
nr:TlpA disulfide reductase family protein [Pedobacter panaciterrae]